MSGKKLTLLALVAGALVVLVPSAVGSSSTSATNGRPVAFQCAGVDQGNDTYTKGNGTLCAEPFADPSWNQYVGHDEPSVLFYSNTPGSGNNQVYQLTLPQQPAHQPNQQGTGGTWDFQLHPAIWFGMALCDDQSAPNPGGSSVGANVPCTPDSDSNIYTGTTPGGTGYIGQHPGAAFMEMQFYPPGWANSVTDSCDATRWCAAMTIDSYSINMNTNAQLNPTCQGEILGGVEYVNFAYITKSGTPLGPPNPLDANAQTFTPNPNLQLLMNGGDKLSVSLQDTTNGLQIVIHDLTSGQTGSMTASAANGFGDITYAPTGTSCTENNMNFHPMYSTSSENTRVPWAAHSYNIAYSDEVGHWEYCNSIDFSVFYTPCTSGGVSDPAGPDGDDFYCASGAQSYLVQVSGCTYTEGDFDGVSYQPVWPGINGNVGDANTPKPITFSSPQFNGGQNYDRMAFETDLPRVEGPDISPDNNCIRSGPDAGSGCVNPPNGANFYPMFTARKQDGGCRWLEGGPSFPGNTNNFGGEVAEYGPLVTLAYPTASSSGQPAVEYLDEDFRNVQSSNPCLP